VLAMWLVISLQRASAIAALSREFALFLWPVGQRARIDETVLLALIVRSHS